MLRLDFVQALSSNIFVESNWGTRRRGQGWGEQPRDTWRHSGGKLGVCSEALDADTIDDSNGNSGSPECYRGAGLYLAKRMGKIKRSGQSRLQPELTYHQYNCDRSARPDSGAGPVTLFHIVVKRGGPSATRRGSTPADWMSSAVLQHTAWHRLYSTSAAATMTSPSAAWMLSQ